LVNLLLLPPDCTTNFSFKSKHHATYVGNIVQLMAFVRQILQATLFVRMYLDLSRDIKTTETRHGHAPPRRTGFWIDDQKL